jgi:broad specificity phosphatase PhoE
MCVFFVRHGMTNEDLPGHEMVTGWKEIPLNAEGRLNAARAGRFLKSKGITSITASDTKRALQTSHIIADALGLPVIESDRLRSWNMGALQGMPSETAKPFLEFFEKNPDIRVPQGEAFQTFYNRFKGVWLATVSYVRKFPNAVPLLVTHSQDLDIIPWFIKGIEPGKLLQFGEGIKPGGVLEMRVDGGDISVRKLRV